MIGWPRGLRKRGNIRFEHARRRSRKSAKKSLKNSIPILAFFAIPTSGSRTLRVSIYKPRDGDYKEVYATALKHLINLKLRNYIHLTDILQGEIVSQCFDGYFWEFGKNNHLELEYITTKERSRLFKNNYRASAQYLEHASAIENALTNLTESGLLFYDDSSELAISVLEHTGSGVRADHSDIHYYLYAQKHKLAVITDDADFVNIYAALNLTDDAMTIYTANQFALGQYRELRQ